MFQASLLDDPDLGAATTAGAVADPAVADPGVGGVAVPGPLGPAVRRTILDHGAWVDVRRQWIAGSDALLDTLLRAVPWHAERRQMYDRTVDVPRLLKFYGEDEPLPDPALDRMRDALNDRYAAELGEPLRTCGLCLYRDGADSVAWHGDRVGRGATHDTIVAIVSIGTPRALLLRPGTGGATLRHDLGHGDLLVMGGSCQRTWEHAIPKTTRVHGPRVSIQFRPRGVR